MKIMLAKLSLALSTKVAAVITVEEILWKYLVKFTALDFLMLQDNI